jgi:hypothetical protein
VKKLAGLDLLEAHPGASGRWLLRPPWT